MRANSTFMAAPAVKTVGLVALTALVLAGCTRGSDLNQGGTLPTQQAAPVNPAPVSPVQEEQLRPASPTEPQPEDVAIADSVPETPQSAANTEANAQPVTRQALVGAWTVSTGGASCQIFLALTKWSGGYRAASRGCSAAAISDVQAWDVKGKQVVLVDSSGSQAATLYKSGEERFDGSTSGGGGISFTR